MVQDLYRPDDNSYSFIQPTVLKQLKGLKKMEWNWNGVQS